MPCSEVYDNFTVEPSLKTYIHGMQCPPSDLVPVISGNGISPQALYDGSKKAYFYIVNSCDSMNNIRSTLGVDQVACADYQEILDQAYQVYSDVRTVHKFFQPIAYAMTNELEWQVQYITTGIESLFAQKKVMDI